GLGDALDLVGQARVHGFLGGVPGLSLHRGPPVLDGAARLLGVDRGDVVADLVEPLGQVAHLGGVEAHGHRVRLVDHQLAVAGHGDGLARHGDEAGGTGGQALDGDVDGRRVVAQRVENGDAVEHVPTRAIETQVDVLGGQVGQLAHEVLGGDAPIADLVVDQQIHRVLGDVLEGVPVGASLPELRDGPGGLEVVHAAAPGGSGCSCGAGKG